MASGSESLPLGEKDAFFSQRISGGNRRPLFIGATRRRQDLSLADSPKDKLLKRPTREPWNGRKVNPLEENMSSAKLLVVAVQAALLLQKISYLRIKPRLCSSHLLRPEKPCCNAPFTILLLNIFINMPSAQNGCKFAFR